MSDRFVLQNVKRKGSYLTQVKNTAVGAKFNDTNNQRWMVVFKYESRHPKYATLHWSDNSGDYLGLNDDGEVQMVETEAYQWQVVRSGNQYTFQVPTNSKAVKYSRPWSFVTTIRSLPSSSRELPTKRSSGCLWKSEGCQLACREHVMPVDEVTFNCQRLGAYAAASKVFLYKYTRQQMFVRRLSFRKNFRRLSALLEV